MRLVIALGVAGLAGGCGLILDLDPPDPARDAAVRDGGGPQSSDGGVDAGCADEDGDGVTVCAGDCDDTDAALFPGAPFVCRDGEPRSCGDLPEDAPAVCAGLFVATDGDDLSGLGTREAPFASVDRAVEEAELLGGPRRVTVAVGRYVGDVAIGADVSVFGGYARDTWSRAGAPGPTTLEVAHTDGLRLLTGANDATIVDGLTVVQTSADGNALTVEPGGTPTIRGCVIEAGPAAFQSTALLLRGDATVEGCTIRVGDSDGPGAFGVAVDRASPTVSFTDVELSAAASAQTGIVLLDTPPSATIDHCTVSGTGGSSAVAIGLRVLNGGATIDASTLDPGRCTSDCAGLVLDGISLPVVVTNTRAFGGRGSPMGAGLLILGSVSVGSGLEVVNNFFLGGAGGSTPAHAVVFAVSDSARAGRFWNNIIRAGADPGSLPVYGLNADFVPVLFERNALSKETPGVVYRDASGMSFSLAGLNSQPWAMENRETACGLDPAAGTLDLPLGSPCVDVGRAMGSPSFDIYGTPRPRGLGFDLGPHEL